MTDDLAYLPATEAIRRFKARTLSPVDLMEAVIARAEAVEPTVNALPFKFFDEALEKARKAEARFMKTDGRLRALEGLPVAVKDSSLIKGQPTTSGSLILKDFVPEYTSPVNERVLKAGAIVHARTATPEFCCSGYCHSLLHGVTRNPWNTDYTPGGSSGGSGASLASGTTTLATGSDIGGSIRIPASCSGVVGYKPPYGRNPGDMPFNLDPYCHTGPMARTVADTVLLQNIMAGPHPQDIATLKPKLRLPTTYKPIEGWKIAYSMDLGFYEVAPSVRANTEAALEVFRALGATVEPVELPWNWDLLEAAVAHLTHLFATSIAETVKTSDVEVTDYVREFVEASTAASPERYLWSLHMASAAYWQFTEAMRGFNLLVCPTTALPAVAADFSSVTHRIEINGKEVPPQFGWFMTMPFNMLSRCPVLSVPSGRAPNGVPTGIQLVGQTYSDRDVFQAATAYEAATGTFYDAADTRPAP